MSSRFVISGLSLALGAICVVPPSARAQLTLGLGGGATVPVGDFSKATKTGYNVLATLGLRVPAFPLGLRVDGMFNQIPSQFSGVTHSQIWTVNANLVANLVNTPHAPLVPYLVAGVGYYNTRYRVSTSGDSLSGSGDLNDNDFGLNAGIGIRLGLGNASVFAEGRYHYIFMSGTHLQMIPFTLGINFGG